MAQKTEKAKRRAAWIQLLTALAVVVLDRLMKLWIVYSIPGQTQGETWVRTGENIPLLPGVIHLTQVHNTGAAFSILENMRWPLLVITAALMAVIVWALFSEKVKHGTGRWALGLVLGGAVGNAIDRALTGYVVDMFEVEFMDYAVFNVADIFIVCGAILFCVYILFFEGKQDRRAESFRIVPREQYEAREQDGGEENEDGN